MWWREEAVNIEHQNRAEEWIIFKDHLLGEGQYYDLQNQIQFDDTVIEMSLGNFKNMGKVWGAQAKIHLIH